MSNLQAAWYVKHVGRPYSPKFAHGNATWHFFFAIMVLQPISQALFDANGYPTEIPIVSSSFCSQEIMFKYKCAIYVHVICMHIYIYIHI